MPDKDDPAAQTDQDFLKLMQKSGDFGRIEEDQKEDGKQLRDEGKEPTSIPSDESSPRHAD